MIPGVMQLPLCPRIVNIASYFDSRGYEITANVPGYTVSMKRIIVASKNPAKIQAALSGFKRTLPSEEFTIEGISVESGVNEQPNGGWH
jgi:hypothetical protein